MRPGFHISIAGGLHKVVPRALRLGCESIQLFSRSPRSFRSSPLNGDQAAELRKGLSSSGLRPVFLHAPYVINLASSDPRLWGLSVKMLREELRRAPVLGAAFVLLHPGRYGRSEPLGALWRMVEGLAVSLRACPEGVGLALENTAGQQGELGSSLEDLALMVHAVEGANLRIMLDVAHLYQAGYPVNELSGLDETLARMDQLLSLDAVIGLHLNDSRTPRGSRVDRHWHLGEGEIGLDGLRRIVRHPLLSHLPAIMETPRQGVGDDVKNMRVLRRLLEE